MNDDLTEAIAEIVARQRDDQFLVTAWILTGEEVDQIRDAIEPDDFPADSIGRYVGACIFRAERYSSSVRTEMGLLVGVHRGVRYEYIHIRTSW